MLATNRAAAHGARRVAPDRAGVRQQHLFEFGAGGGRSPPAMPGRWARKKYDSGRESLPDQVGDAVDLGEEAVDGGYTVFVTHGTVPRALGPP